MHMQSTQLRQRQFYTGGGENTTPPSHAWTNLHTAQAHKHFHPQAYILPKFNMDHQLESKIQLFFMKTALL